MEDSLFPLSPPQEKDEHRIGDISMEFTATELMLGTTEDSLFNDSLDDTDTANKTTLPPHTEHNLNDSLDFELTQLPFDVDTIPCAQPQAQLNDRDVVTTTKAMPQTAATTDNTTTNDGSTTLTADVINNDVISNDVISNASKVVPNFGRKSTNATKKQKKCKADTKDHVKKVGDSKSECVENASECVEEKEGDDQCVPDHTDNDDNLSKPKFTTSLKKSQEQKKQEKEEKRKDAERKRQEKEQKKCEAQQKKTERERMKKEKQLEIEQKKIEREQKKIEQALKKTENVSRTTKTTKRKKKESDITDPHSETNDDHVQQANMNQNDSSETVDKVDGNEQDITRDDDIESSEVVGVTEPNENATLPENQCVVAVSPHTTDEPLQSASMPIQNTETCEDTLNKDSLNDDEMATADMQHSLNKTCVAVKVEKLKIVFGKSKVCVKPSNDCNITSESSTKVKTSKARNTATKSRKSLPKNKQKRQRDVEDSNECGGPKMKHSKPSNYTGPVWVQCESCQKWRQLNDCTDPLSLPNSWKCNMNTDQERGSCSAPEESWSDDIGDNQEFVETPFIPGSLVWAKMDSYPWWPAMVEEDPNEETYYKMGKTDFSSIPVKFHVVFFDTPVSRGWVSNFHIHPYSIESDYNNRTGVAVSQKLKRGLKEARKHANRASTMTIDMRLIKYSFAKRFRQTTNRKRKNVSLEDDESYNLCTTKSRRVVEKNEKKNGVSDQGRECEVVDGGECEGVDGGECEGVDGGECEVVKECEDIEDNDIM